MIFSPATYPVLQSEGFFDILRSLKSFFDFDYCGSSFRWRQSVVFDAVSSIIISDEKQELHMRICDSFDRNLSTNNCDVQQARHYSIVCRFDEALDQYMDAGKRSEKLFDYTHSVSCYNQAKLCLRQKSSIREKISCSAALGWSLQASELYDDAVEELESALELTKSLPEDNCEEEYLLLTGTIC